MRQPRPLFCRATRSVKSSRPAGSSPPRHQRAALAAHLLPSFLLFHPRTPRSHNLIIPLALMLRRRRGQPPDSVSRIHKSLKSTNHKRSRSTRYDSTSRRHRPPKQVQLRPRASRIPSSLLLQRIYPWHCAAARTSCHARAAAARTPPRYNSFDKAEQVGRLLLANSIQTPFTTRQGCALCTRVSADTTMLAVSLVPHAQLSAPARHAAPTNPLRRLARFDDVVLLPHRMA